MLLPQGKINTHVSLKLISGPLQLYRPSRYKQLNCHLLLPALFQAQPEIPQNCHYAEGDQVLPHLYLLASIGTNKVWQSLFSGTLVFVAGHINLAVTQAKTVYKNQFLVT